MFYRVGGGEGECFILFCLRMDRQPDRILYAPNKRNVKHVLPFKASSFFTLRAVLTVQRRVGFAAGNAMGEVR